MSDTESFTKLWDAETISIGDVVVEIERVEDMSQPELSRMYDAFNRFGVVVLQHAPTEHMVEEMHRIGALFGNSVTHDRADEHGLVVVGELAGYGEFVGASSGPHLMHTGGTFMGWNDVPKVVILQCEVQARVGGQSMLASAAAAYRHLALHNPEALALLRDPEVFSIVRSAQGTSAGKFGETGGVRKAVFDMDRLGNGRGWLTFRFDGQVRLDLRPDAAHEAFDALLNFLNDSANHLDFKLQPNQVLICDNTSVVHSRTAFQTGSGRKLNRLQVDGDHEGLVFGFPSPT